MNTHWREGSITHRVAVGVRIRRKGILAALFGDEIGTVVRLGHHEIEVTFGLIRITLYENQFALSEPIARTNLIESAAEPRDFFNTIREQQIVVQVDSTALRKAEQLIESCEHCNENAAIPFDVILDRVTGSNPSVTDYILEVPAKCPNCRREIFEKTLVEPK